MKQFLRFVIGSAVAACLALGAQPTTFAQVTNSNAAGAEKAHLSIRDSAFLRHAAQANLLDARIGQLASEKGSTQDVKSWGQKIAQERNQAFQELTRLAQTKGMTIPTTLDTRHQKTLDRLSSSSGTAFDNAVLQHVVRSDESAVRSTEAESKHGQDPDIKQFATTSLPTLQADLKQTRTLVAHSQAATHEPAGAQKQ